MMKQFLRREWLSLLCWSIAALLLWYAVVVDRSRLGETLGLIATGLVFEFIHRVIGSNKEDRT